MKKGKPILIGGILAVVVVSVATQWLPGRRMTDVTDINLQNATDLWESKSPANYWIKIQVEGRLNDIWEVSVEQGNAIKVIRNGQEMVSERTKDVWTVPGMFRMLEYDLDTQERLREQGTDLMVRAEFDSENGIPVGYQRLDYSTRQSASWKVLEFKIRIENQAEM